MNSDRDKLKHVPKADVHNHLILGMSRETLRKHYECPDLILPDHYDGLDGMIDIIKGSVYPILNTDADVLRFFTLAIEDSIADGVTYLEASIDYNLVRFFAHDINNFIEAVASLKDAFVDRIHFRPEIGINKIANVLEINEDIVACIKSGVFDGIDLYGPEQDQDLLPFQNIFKEARGADLKCKVHIGEFSDHHSITEAIEVLNPHEIQHGISAVSSEAVMDMILNKGIRLNICPSSNIALGAVRSLAEHPIRTLFDHGLDITINTDDLLLFDKTITDQYMLLLENNIFTFDEIDVIRGNSLSAI